MGVAVGAREVGARPRAVAAWATVALNGARALGAPTAYGGAHLLGVLAAIDGASR